MLSKGAGFPPMRNKLRRYYGHGHLYFLTFSCYQRRALLGSVRARNLFVRILDEVRKKRSFLLVGYVVMPDHVHLLIGEPEGNRFDLRQTPFDELRASRASLRCRRRGGW